MKHSSPHDYFGADDSPGGAASQSPFLTQEFFLKPEAEVGPRAATLFAESPFAGALESREGPAADAPAPPFFQGLASDFEADDDAAGDELEFGEVAGRAAEREWGEVEHQAPPARSPLDALAPSELKAVRITSTFETGRAGSFGGLTGNFDGQGVSFGLMNFAWKAGSLLTLLKEFLRDYPADFDTVFGPDAARFREVILATIPDPKHPKRRLRDLDTQMEFAVKVLNDANNKIREPWRTYFGRLEVNPAFRRIQVGAVRRAAARARYWCWYFGLKTERSYAFMFDLVSSHGGAWLNAPKYKGRRRKLLRAMLEKKKASVGRAELTELEILEVIANMIADVSLKEYRERVRVRKLWFVRGRGTVQHKDLDLAKDFGVTDDPPDFGGATPSNELAYETELQAPDDDDEVWPRELYADEEFAGDSGALELEGRPGEAHEEPEDYLAGEQESSFAEGEDDSVSRPETLVCSPGELEMRLDEPEEELESSPDEEQEESGLSVLSKYFAELQTHKPRTASTPVELALVVPRWGEGHAAKVSGVRLKVYECDLGEPGRSDAATAANVQMAEFLLDLAPNPELVKKPGLTGVPQFVVTNARWANATLEKSYKATSKADLVLKLGGKSFPLWLPRADILEEGTESEIGFLLDDGAGHKLERPSFIFGPATKVAIPDYLNSLLTIPGRFGDPQRDASVEMDGIKFDEFLKGGNRREFIRRWLDEHAALREAAGEPNADLRTVDIVKAWFVIHDVGVGASLTDRRFKANQTATKAGAVHGFLNRAGYYAATHDFVKDRAGTVFEFLSKKGRAVCGGRTVNIETVPDIERGVPDNPDGSHGTPSNAGLYASIGYRRAYVKVKGKNVYAKKVDYYKWTTAALEVLADLYIFASARARHLLTITAHKEMDRNLGRSLIWREHTAAEVRAGAGRHWETARTSPSNYHGDPFAFDVQALYDIITQKLNALGGRQMPAGARYGIHPRRVRKADGEDVGNGDSHLHEFPHQSDPNLKTDTGIKKTGWWNVS